MPNWERPGRDMPTRADEREMDRQREDREREYAAVESRVQRYERDHPGCSWAEAEYYSRHEEN